MPEPDDTSGQAGTMPLGSRIGLPHALRGLRVAWREDRNLRIETAVGVVALLATFALRVSVTPVLVAVTLVLALEVVNSAVERAIDLTTPHSHPLARDAKDLAAGAVTIAAIGSILLGFVHLGPPLLAIAMKGRP